MADDNGAKIVAETGLALVHKDEVVLPAAGSEAQAKQVADDARTTVHYHFPVEIEVVAGCGGVDPHKLADMTLEKLARSLRASRI